MKNFFYFLLFAFYRGVIAPLGLSLVLLLSFFNSKIREGLQLRSRKHLVQRNEASGKQVVWVHCSSGEFEYARSVLRELKKKDAEVTTLVTYFSPTYRRAIEVDPAVDISLPLPLDLPGPVQAFLKKWKPSVLAISRTDLWPELLYQTQKMKVPIVLFAATLASSQQKIQPLFRWLLAWRFQWLDYLYCVSSEDQNNFSHLKIASKIETLGDPRYDQVFYRLSQIKPLPLASDQLGGPVYVAGSTWPEDEKVLIPGLAPLLKKKELTLLLVPHEPTPTHLELTEKLLQSNEIPYRRYSQINSNKIPQGEVLLVDKVGVLAELYTLGNYAFVGGSFRGSVHSVMEALAAGLLVFVGPTHDNNREALQFKRETINDGLPLVRVVTSARDFQTGLEEAMKIPSLESKEKVKQRVLTQQGAGVQIATRILGLAKEKTH